MKIEIPNPKFKHGQRVFFLREEPTQHGIQHRCTSCEQLHYAERYMPVVVEGVIAGCTNWALVLEDGARELALRGPFYQIDEVARGGSRHGANEREIFLTLEEAHAAKRPMENL